MKNYFQVKKQSAKENMCQIANNAKKEKNEMTNTMMTNIFDKKKLLEEKKFNKESYFIIVKHKYIINNNKQNINSLKKNKLFSFLLLKNVQ